MPHEQAPEHTTAPHSISDAYYHWLGTIYARLLDDESRAIDRKTDHIIDEARDELAPHDYHPDLVDTLRIDIAKARTTLRHDREAFAQEWRKIEQDLAVKLLSIADKTDVELNAMREKTHEPRK
ncbi:MAG: hypothetical protein ACYCY3_08475 [Halothiobacillus sp.]